MPGCQNLKSFQLAEDNIDLQDEGGGEGDQAGYDLSVLRFDHFERF